MLVMGVSAVLVTSCNHEEDLQQDSTEKVGGDKDVRGRIGSPVDDVCIRSPDQGEHECSRQHEDDPQQVQDEEDDVIVLVGKFEVEEGQGDQMQDADVTKDVLRIMTGQVVQADQIQERDQQVDPAQDATVVKRRSHDRIRCLGHRVTPSVQGEGVGKRQLERKRPG